MLGQHLQLSVEYAQALHRGLVGLDVVDADLEVLQAGIVELLNARRTEQVAVRDQAREHAAGADVANQVIQLRVQHGLAAAHRDAADAEIGQGVGAFNQDVESNGRRDMVVLVAVGTGDVATPGRNHVGQDRMVGIDQRLGDHAGLAKTAIEAEHLAANARAQRYGYGWHRSRTAAAGETPAFASIVNYRGGTTESSVRGCMAHQACSPSGAWCTVRS